jgi:hypothetical protein
MTTQEQRVEEIAKTIEELSSEKIRLEIEMFRSMLAAKLSDAVGRTFRDTTATVEQHRKLLTWCMNQRGDAWLIFQQCWCAPTGDAQISLQVEMVSKSVILDDSLQRLVREVRWHSCPPEEYAAAYEKAVSLTSDGVALAAFFTNGSYLEAK